MSASQGTYSVAMPISPPPPSDLGTYARSMHQHTKRQMESIPQSPPRSTQHDQPSPTGLPNGLISRSRNSSQYSN
ncbi:hypothetical protein C8A00DRAFT_40045 [Chaetomidium leptoderma]|uniref:Uncharacterized protein n=1 Tax=Chaetomidium leptoderma TaxID=669021 RepID=A0AAN6VTZ6_9PEZI|nr:hypothetical protein C8A00DRAFT_40045 [Chaetomidium leptoderma]